MKKFATYFHIKIRNYMIAKAIERCRKDQNANGPAYVYFLHHAYAHRRVMSIEECNAFILQKLKEDNPVLIGRLGGSEQNCFMSYEFDKKRCKKKAVNQLRKWSGFFPEDTEYANLFIEIQREAMKEVDLLGVWNLLGEEYCIQKYMDKDCKLVAIGALQPWRIPPEIEPWTVALKGKKVLVVHPFQKSIEKQYQIREKLFLGTEILPKFDLITYKAVQSLGGQSDCQDWGSALEKMKMDISQIDFDIAILGCGAYGLPLAAHIKKMGKKAIHLGGVTQLLFGIMGSRWEENYPFIGQYVNDSWVRPLDEERPVNAQTVENACYW